MIEYPSLAKIALYERCQPALEDLEKIIAPLALRHPQAPVPPEVLADTRDLLSDIHRVLSSEVVHGRLLELRGSRTWAGLLTQLTLVGRALHQFEKTYRVYNNRRHEWSWLTAKGRARPSPETAADIAKTAKSDPELLSLVNELAKIEAKLST